MKRKQYEKPLMKVVVMNQRVQLLADSPGSLGSSNPFTGGGDPLNP